MAYISAKGDNDILHAALDKDSCDIVPRGRVLNAGKNSSLSLVDD
jgi:hypothetical protein